MDILKKILEKIKFLINKIPSYLILPIVLIIFVFIANNYNIKKEQQMLEKANSSKTGTIKVNPKISEEEIKAKRVYSRGSIAPTRKAKTKGEVLMADDLDDIFGEKDAPITIVEYMSYKCPHCVSFYQDTAQKLKTEYIDTGKVKYIKRAVMQKGTVLAVMVVKCAKQEKKQGLINELYNTVDDWGENSKQKDKIRKIALNHGFTKKKFNKCVADEKLAKSLLEKQELELSILKIYSTPTIFIGSEVFTGGISYDELKEKIDLQILKRAKYKKEQELKEKIN
jgi:protein-disulfide isomerase